jgi:ABC-type phosphate transport system ATPase subunit
VTSASQRHCPYQGLIPYEVDDALFFFGREKETRLIAANLYAAPLTLLYGASGVGKSSVLRAGVINHLRPRDDLLVVEFHAWQSDPLGDLTDPDIER